MTHGNALPRRLSGECAAAGSSAFPGFAPYPVEGVGLCSYGGAVNNAPIAWALEDGSVEQIIVVSARPGVVPPPTSLTGFGLLGQLAGILIQRDPVRFTYARDPVGRLSGISLPTGSNGVTYVGSDDRVARVAVENGRVRFPPRLTSTARSRYRTQRRPWSFASSSSATPVDAERRPWRVR